MSIAGWSFEPGHHAGDQGTSAGAACIVYREADGRAVAGVHRRQRVVQVGYRRTVRETIEWWAAPRYGGKRVPSVRDGVTAMAAGFPVPIPEDLVVALESW